MGAGDCRGAGCPEPLEGGALLRAAADRELSVGQQARLEAHLAEHPEDEARIAHERELRACCARVMAAPRCPEALRAKITAMCPSAGVAAAPDASPTPSAVEELAPLTRSPSFWQRPAARAVLAAAAVVVFAVAGLFFLDAVRGPQSVSPSTLAAGGVTLQQASFADEVASFVAREHNRCWESQEAADRKFVERDADKAVQRVRGLVGSTVHLAALEQPAANLVFRGAGDCHVPGSKGKSVHLRFDVPAHDGEPASAVSVFATPDTGELPIRPGVTYSVNTARCGEPGMTVLVWTQDGTVFYLVADSTTGACNKMLGAMGLAAPTEGL